MCERRLVPRIPPIPSIDTEHTTTLPRIPPDLLSMDPLPLRRRVDHPPRLRKILRTQGQHNIALVGAGRLGQAIAGSSIFGEHGITIAAVLDNDERKIGTPIGGGVVTDYSRLRDVIRDKNIVVGVLAVPAAAAQQAADDLVDAGVRIIFNYSEALLHVPADVTVHTANPAVELLHALYFHLA